MVAVSLLKRDNMWSIHHFSGVTSWVFFTIWCLWFVLSLSYITSFFLIFLGRSFIRWTSYLMWYLFLAEAVHKVSQRDGRGEFAQVYSRLSHCICIYFAWHHFVFDEEKAFHADYSVLLGLPHREKSSYCFGHFSYLFKHAAFPRRKQVIF